MALPWKRVSFAGGGTATALLGAAALVNYQSSALATLLAITGMSLGLWFVIEISVIGWQAAGGLYVQYHKVRYSMLIVILVGAVVGGSLFGGVWWLRGRIAPNPKIKSEPEPSIALADFGKRLDSLTEAVTRNPSIDADGKLKILREDHDRLSKEKEELTNEQKETLEDQELTLKSLEEGRKRHLESQELERRQTELASQQQAIEREEKIKKLEKAREPQEIEFAKKYAPIVDHAITGLHQRLRPIAKESGKEISTDFPGSPSIYKSNMFKENKLVGGNHVMRVGSDQEEWVFRISVGGPPDLSFPQDVNHSRFLRMSIDAGSSLPHLGKRASLRIMTFSGVAPDRVLHIEFWPDLNSAAYLTKGRKTPPSQKDYALTDYQKAIDAALNELIQQRFNVAPLKPKP